MRAVLAVLVLTLAPALAQTDPAERLEGRWRLADDVSVQIGFARVAGGLVMNMLDGDEVAFGGPVTFPDGCGAYAAKSGETLLAVALEDVPDEPLCYRIDRLEADRLTLFFIPTGQALDYERAR